MNMTAFVRSQMEIIQYIDNIVSKLIALYLYNYISVNMLNTCNNMDDSIRQY